MLRCLLLFLALTVATSAQVPLGASKKEVIDALGWPKSVSGTSSREILNYPEFTILLVEGKVVNLQRKPIPSGKKPKAAAPAISTPPRQTPTPLAPMTAPGYVQPTPTKRPSPAPSIPQPVPTQNARPRPPASPDTLGFVVIRTLAPWVLLFGLLLGLGLIFEERLKRKRANVRQGLDSTTVQYLGAPPETPLLLSRKSASAADLPLYRRPVAADWSLRLLKEIEWHRFEHLVAAYERELGYNAEVTDFGPDGGIDIRVFEKGSRTPKRIVQCKAFNNQLVDVKLVRELMGVMAHEKASQGAFYTTSEFTSPALELGRGHLDIELVDGRNLLNRISRLLPEAQARLLAVATEGDYTTPTCASCGVKMILKTASKGRREGSSFWGCRSYPRCQQIINISKPA